MSAKAIEWAINADVPPRLQHVLMVLAHFHNGKSGQCNPRVETLAEKMGKSKRPVQYALKELEEMGYIRRVQRRKGAYQASNQFELALDGVVFESADNSTLKEPEECANQHPETTEISTLYSEQEVEHTRARKTNVVKFEKPAPEAASGDISPGVSLVARSQLAEKGIGRTVGAGPEPSRLAHSKQNPELSAHDSVRVAQ